MNKEQFKCLIKSSSSKCPYASMDSDCSKQSCEYNFRFDRTKFDTDFVYRLKVLDFVSIIETNVKCDESIVTWDSICRVINGTSSVEEREALLTLVKTE